MKIALAGDSAHVSLVTILEAHWSAPLNRAPEPLDRRPDQ